MSTIVPEEGPATVAQKVSIIGPDRSLCEVTIAHLYEYMDGAIPREAFEAVKHHLMFCPPCAGALAFEAKLREVIAMRCRDTVPETLVVKITQVISSEQPRT